MLVLKDPAADSSELEYARRALERGELVVVPTDTVYGIAASAVDADAVARLYAVKGRAVEQATAVIFHTVSELRAAFGDDGLSERASWAAAALLPGPWTLIMRNPGALWPWLTGGEAGAPIGVRVPTGSMSLPPIAATSANLAGEPTITRVGELPKELADRVACAVDRGELGVDGAAVASTVLDLTEWELGTGEIRVLRDDGGRAGVALAALAAAPSA